VNMQCVLVCGQGCGGTSAVAGVVHKLGYPMYLPGHSGKHPDTDAGLYEDACLYGALYRMTPETLERVRDVIRTHRRERYGFKNTLLGQALPWVVPLVREAGDDVKVVCVHRTLMSCARGRAEGRCCVPFGRTYPLDEAVQWAMEAKVSLLRGVMTVAEWSVPTYHLSFEHLLEDSEAEVKRLAAFLGADVTDDALEHVRPGLAHY